MKKLFLIGIVFCSLSAVAQDTYMNEQLLNNSQDVIGTSRYVGMCGAMGALGADLSVISWNPAGIGLYRKNDASITFGGLWNKNYIDEENRGAGTFDQAGFVYSFKTESDVCPYVNFAFNFQKKKNYFSNFYADNSNLLGISQMDQLAELASFGYATNRNITGLVLDNNALTPTTFSDGREGYRNKYGGEFNKYTHHSEGSLRGWDFNISTNIKDRAFIGLTFGVDNIDYSSWTNYFEACKYVQNGEDIYGDYSIWNGYRISGHGFNFKLGGIVLPFEGNSFRVGFTVESPTWYKLKSNAMMDYTYYKDDNTCETSKTVESYLEFKPYTPWKFRASMGSTISNKFAWDVDYEYANYASMKQRFSDYDSFGGYKDVVMNNHMQESLNGVHTIRAGVEIRPIAPLSFRLGYNFTSAAYDSDANFDQGQIYNSPSMEYVTRTNYMLTKPVHIVGVGMGYKWKNFYFDLAYKIRHQEADFFAFDDSFTTHGYSFSDLNPDLSGATLNPVPVDLTRHSITCTLGVKF